MIFLGSDHGGFKLKEQLARRLQAAKRPFKDMGAHRLDSSDDYPLIAARVARAVSRGSAHRGILFCRSGVGMSVAANKIRGIRATVATDTWLAGRARRDDDVNVLALPADKLSIAAAWPIVRAFLRTPFRGASRNRRRLRQIKQLEHAQR